MSSVFPQRHQRFNPAGLARFDEMVQRGELEEVYELERQPLESLIALNSTEATERGAPLSVVSVLSVASVVQFVLCS